jgi:predicted Zn-dependent protease
MSIIIRLKPDLGICLLLMALTSPVCAQIGLFSQKQEMEAGNEADAQIRKQQKMTDDRHYNGLVSYLGKRLVRVCERPKLQWTFRVIDSKELNAFSVPGYVYVNTGLLAAVKDDQDALAGVIAHEIGHTCGKHAVKQMEKSSIGGALIGLIGGRNKTTSGLAGVAANLVLLGYSRDDENDADKRAIRYMVRAGYDPNGLLRFFETLHEKEGSGGGGVAAYFRTHPPTADRIERVKKNIAREQDNPENARFREGNEGSDPQGRREPGSKIDRDRS